jgi:hypothetical protein
MKHNLMNKWIVAAGAMMVALTLSLAPASADNKKPKKTETPKNPPVNAPTGLGKVSLACQPTSLSSDVATQVRITNTTGQTIPKGTKINWQTNQGLKDSITVTASAGLPSGKSLDAVNSDWTKNGPCTAYFYKNVK